MSTEERYNFPPQKRLDGPKVVVYSIVMFLIMIPGCSWLTKKVAQVYSSRAPKQDLAREMNESRMKQVEKKEAEERAARAAAQPK